MPSDARGRVAGLLLAAGAGRRLGQPKALVSHRGRLFVDSAAGLLHAAGCAPVVVVLGARADEVRARAELTDCQVVDNPDWADGMGSSLRAGLAALAATSADRVDGVLVLPVDVPGVTVEALARVLAAGTAGRHALVRASYAGAPGHPVLLGRAHWPGVRELATGDVGARDYLRAHPPVDVPCADIASGTDVDRPEDLDRLGP
jgi:CTP:molybdopterin cytidylyltransferase MocA